MEIHRPIMKPILRRPPFPETTPLERRRTIMLESNVIPERSQYSQMFFIIYDLSCHTCRVISRRSQQSSVVFRHHVQHSISVNRRIPNHHTCYRKDLYVIDTVLLTTYYILFPL